MSITQCTPAFVLPRRTVEAASNRNTPPHQHDVGLTASELRAVSDVLTERGRADAAGRIRAEWRGSDKSSLAARGVAAHRRS